MSGTTYAYPCCNRTVGSETDLRFHLQTGHRKSELPEHIAAALDGEGSEREERDPVAAV